MTQPRAKGFNELEKLCRIRETAQFSALITYSREEHHEENLQIIKKQWGKSSELLLVFLVRFGYNKGRQFGDLETYSLKSGVLKRERTQPALPWERKDTRWSKVPLASNAI